MLIAQVSDIHASAENDHLLRFERVLKWLCHLQPDVLVLTGDLTDGPWAEGYQQIASRLRQLDFPSRVLPGNSDDRRLMSALWGDEHSPDDPATDALHFIHDVAGLRLIGLDATVDSQTYGSVTEHLPWLEKQLHAAADAPSLLFMHHHLFTSGIAALDESICRGLNQLEAVLRRTPGGVRAIFCGHVHRPIAGSFAGVPAYICGSVCPANPLWFGTAKLPPADDPPALMIHRFTGNMLTSHHVSVL